MMHDHAGILPVLERTHEPANVHGLLVFLDEIHQRVAVTPGVHDIVQEDFLPPGPPRQAVLLAMIHDGSCVHLVPDTRARAISGQVTLEALPGRSGGALDSFDVLVGPGLAPLKGRFDATACAIGRISDGKTCQ